MTKGYEELLSYLYELYGASNTSGETKASNDVQSSSGTDIENGKDERWVWFYVWVYEAYRKSLWH